MMMMTKGRRHTTKKSFNIIFLPSSTRDTHDILLVLFLNKFPFYLPSATLLLPSNVKMKITEMRLPKKDIRKTMICYIKCLLI